MASSAVSPQAVPVVIAFRNRPFYLWNCLDAVHRFTQTPSRFVLIDMASDDPLIAGIVRSFQRRRPGCEYVRMDSNDPRHLIDWLTRQLPKFGDIFAYVEGDAVLVDRQTCWLAEMLSLMQANPALAMLGAAIDRRDFVDPAVARQLEPDMPAEQLSALIKAHSPERRQELPPSAECRIFQPHNPAGRLMMLRCAALAQVGGGEDSALHHKLIAAGYETGIATGVLHRHLSLLNIFDHPDYDLAARDRYMAQLNG